MARNRERIRTFRNLFTVTDAAISAAVAELPNALVVLYTECQAFAEKEIKSLLERFLPTEIPHI